MLGFRRVSPDGGGRRHLRPADRSSRSGPRCPLTRDGIKATSTLSKDGIRVDVTLCFSPAQALLAAKAGAYIVRPFVGRLDDVGWTGMDLINSIT